MPRRTYSEDHPRPHTNPGHDWAERMHQLLAYDRQNGFR